ncbi:MAG: hypothetical protein QXG65_00820 [Thermoplasmata archaeon]
MSDAPPDAEVRAIRRRMINLYDTLTALMLLGIAILILYIVRIGPLTSPGAQQSFGLALSLMFLMGAFLFHVLDRTYRTWPLGRRFVPTRPARLSDGSVARFLRIVVVVAAGASLAYLITVGIIL